MSRRHVCLVVILLLLLVTPGAFRAHASRNSPMLRANIKETVYRNPPQAIAGQVVHEESLQPLVGVEVNIPRLGYRTRTGADGRFVLPQTGEQPTIVGFAKSGYLPASRTLSAETNHRQPLQVTLRKTRDSLVLDDQVRHLGDDSYSPFSAGADRFRRQSEGPVLSRRFVLNEPVTGTIMLEIGSVIGLDTQAAHAAGQSRFHRFSTPMQVKVNGYLVGQVALNGDRQRLGIPAGVLRLKNVNTLTIETGRKVADGLDYDDVELMLLTLHR